MQASLVRQLGNMQKFKSNPKYFIQRTWLRISFEIAVLIFMAWFFMSEISESWPVWIKVTLIVFLLLYIGYGIYYYPKAKALAQDFFIQLDDDSLVFPSVEGVKKIPYHDLAISKIVKKRGEVVKIHLKTTFGQSMVLQGLYKMNDLNDQLNINITVNQ